MIPDNSVRQAGALLYVLSWPSGCQVSNNDAPHFPCVLLDLQHHLNCLDYGTDVAARHMALGHTMFRNAISVYQSNFHDLGQVELHEVHNTDNRNA